MGQSMRVTLQLLKVFDALLQAPDDGLWGFELMKITGLQSGTLYPLLARMEAAGWIESDWETQGVPGRPRRRYYSLTGVGVTAARQELANLPGRAAAAARPPARPAFGGLA
jgi:PadR family transcriptional regulator, regulatory protein PadR